MKGELSKIGLSKYEIECYLTLLKFGEMKGNDVAVKAEIPRTSTYPTLERLEKKKFVYLIQDKPKIYRPITPKIAIESYIERKFMEFKEDAKGAITALENIVEYEKEDSVKLFFGKEQSHKSALETQKNIRKEYLVMGDGLNKKTFIKFYQSWIQMLNSGVEIYTIMPEKNKVGALEYITQLKIKGANIAFYDDINNLSFTISDNKRASIGIKSDKFEGGRVVVRIEHEDFAKNQRDFFFSIWKKSIKF